VIDIVIMNLVFFALLDSFVSFFRDEVFSNIDTSELAGRNVRDILKSYFEENPISDTSKKILFLNQILVDLVIIFFQKESQIYKIL